MDVAVDFAGLRLRTPFLIGAGMHTGSGDQFGHWVPAMVEHHWAGIVTKTYMSNCDQVMRPYLWTSRQYRRFAMQNSGPNLTEWDAHQQEVLAENVKLAHEAGLAVIASMMGNSLSEWRRSAEEVTATGVDAMELNLSCPAAIGVVEGNKLGGYHAGQNPEATAAIVAEVTTATKLPVIAKLTALTADPNSVARAARDHGAAGVAAINTLQGILGVDVDTGFPFCSDVYNNSFKSGISGPAIKPIGLRVVADLAMEFPDLPISGIGGISDWRSAVEYLMVGAACVQVCTGVMWHGFKLGSDLHRGLVDFMREKGYRRVEDFRRKALQHITTKAVPCPNAVAVVDEAGCNACGLCIEPCTEASYGALSIVGGHLLVDAGQCGGCGLCTVVCNRDAIHVRNPVTA